MIIISNTGFKTFHRLFFKNKPQSDGQTWALKEKKQHRGSSDKTAPRHPERECVNHTLQLLAEKQGILQTVQVYLGTTEK